jgi:hypothetical protein
VRLVAGCNVSCLVAQAWWVLQPAQTWCRCKFEVFGSLRTLSAAADSPASILSQEVSCQDFESNINTADPEWTPPQLQVRVLVLCPLSSTSRSMPS